ncbi:MAG TPA: hypothetical protein DCM07_03770, partial [Planctomycetaceae bacterium]|nr:hypothetical protein [Planctomycetaceae bacterium]
PEGGQGGAVAVTLLGGLILVIVLGWLPILQAHFAAENRFRAMFELKTIRRKFKRAPLLWMLS